MKTDLAAAELFSSLNDLWPFYGQNQLLAQMHVEDVIRQQVEQERDRVRSMLLTHIRLLERGGSYGKAAANHLNLILTELDSEQRRDFEEEDKKHFYQEADDAQEAFRRRDLSESP